MRLAVAQPTDVAVLLAIRVAACASRVCATRLGMQAMLQPQLPSRDRRPAPILSHTI